MSAGNEPKHRVPALLSDLDRVRKRIDQAQEWHRDGETSVMAAALAVKTKHLCQQAFQCDEPASVQELLQEAEECLRDLETLFGLH